MFCSLKKAHNSHDGRGSLRPRSIPYMFSCSLDQLWPIWLENPERLSDMYESLIYHSKIFIHWQKHLDAVIRAHMLINPIPYGILSFSQLPGGVFRPTPQEAQLG